MKLVKNQRRAVRTATNAAQQGANIGGGVGTTGGDIVGSIFGAASLLGEGTGIVNDERQAKQQAAEAERRKVEQAKAEAERKAQVQANNRDLSQGKQWDNPVQRNTAGTAEINGTCTD